MHSPFLLPFSQKEMHIVFYSLANAREVLNFLAFYSKYLLATTQPFPKSPKKKPLIRPKKDSKKNDNDSSFNSLQDSEDIIPSKIIKVNSDG